jgi:hypothetical protein
MATRVKHGPKRARNASKAGLKAGVRYDEQAKMFIGYSPALHIYSQATTEDRARRALEGAISLFVGALSLPPLGLGTLRPENPPPA